MESSDVRFIARRTIDHSPCAYLRVQSAAVLSCCTRSFLYSMAISPTSGSSKIYRYKFDRRIVILPGLASVKSEDIDSNIFETVSAGDHWSLRISRQMYPCELTLQW